MSGAKDIASVPENDSQTINCTDNMHTQTVFSEFTIEEQTVKFGVSGERVAIRTDTKAVWFNKQDLSGASTDIMQLGNVHVTHVALYISGCEHWHYSFKGTQANAEDVQRRFNIFIQQLLA